MQALHTAQRCQRGNELRWADAFLQSAVTNQRDPTWALVWLELELTSTADLVLRILWWRARLQNKCPKN